MNDAIHALLSRWANFYLITGTAAAALTGLQFVVQTLIASRLGTVVGDDPEAGIAAFGSPTVVHFSLALLLSALLCAPWTAYGSLRLLVGAIAAGALTYAAVVTRRTFRQQVYRPAAEDWLFHVILPVVAYAAVFLAAYHLEGGPDDALVAFAGATLLLICVGIHNAWDTVTYLTVLAVRQAGDAAPPSRPPLHGKRKKSRR